ncbi:MAG: hypothetical protein MI921_04620 [Cytophagales bacterium]|nr:hypothetical protein [Cytophagales bacterium]
MSRLLQNTLIFETCIVEADKIFFIFLMVHIIECPFDQLVSKSSVSNDIICHRTAFLIKPMRLPESTVGNSPLSVDREQRVSGESYT